MSLGLCVLGCGAFARDFARSIAGLRGDIDLYFASRDAARAREYADALDGADAFGSYDAAAADPRVDALYVCTPHHLHREHVELAVRHRRHALVEKPIAGSLADADAIVRLADTGGVNVMVAENYRFLPAVVEAKRLIDQGGLGAIRLVQMQEQYPFKPSGWRNRADQNGGGVLIDGGIHKVSALAYLAGRPGRVFAREVMSAQPGLEAEDGVVVMTEGPDGIVGVINHSWTVAPSDPHHWVAISGTTGNLYFEVGRPWLRFSDHVSQTIIGVDDHPNGLAPMVREFHRSILEGRRPAMTASEGTADLALVLRAYESMETGLPVTVQS